MKIKSGFCSIPGKTLIKIDTSEKFDHIIYTHTHANKQLQKQK